MEDLMKTLSALEVERDYYRQVAERLGQKALTDAQDFSQMIRDLRQREIKLRQSQEKLGQTIEERTAELVTRNKELSESTLRYHSLVNQIPHGVYTLRVSDTGAMQFEYLSPPLCQILDIDPEEVKRNATLAFSIAHPDDREELERSTREATDQRIPFRWEGRYVIHQEVRWIRIEADPTTTPTGDIVWNGVLSDITEQRLIQEKLKESEERLNFLVKNSSDSLVLINADGSQRYVSPAAERITGYPVSELEGRLIDTLIHPDDLKGVVAAWNEAVEHPEKTVTVQYRHIHKTQGWVYSEAIAQSFFAEPAINGVIASVRDITERKKIEEAVRESEERLSSAAKAANFGVYSYDFDNGQAYYSLEFLSFYGLPPESPLELDEDLTPKSLHPDDKSSFLTRMKAANDPCGSGILEHTYRIIRPDGQVRWLRVTGQTSFSGNQPDDRPLQANGIIQDITDGKRLAEEQKKLERQRQQLQKAESLKTMAGAIAHHFNNQLGAVMGNLEMAIDDLPPGSSSVTLNEAMKASRRAAEVSSLMLTYLGQSVIKHAPLDLSKTCRQSLPLLQAIVPPKILFTTDLPIPGPIINANADQILQVLTNLVTNAWEAEDKNTGTIDLTVRIGSPTEISAIHRFPVDWQPQDLTYACIAVTDSGCGIADEDIGMIFDPFYSSKFPGRGLGLAVLLGIVKAHDGAVTVESEKGNGSTFRVFLPMSAEQRVLQSEAATQTLAMEGGGTVLLVEDEEILRNMAQTMLTRLGFKVFTAKDGVEAVEEFKKHLNEIHVVVSDLSMPRMDGWETLSALRRICPDIPVVFVSGHDESEVITDDHVEHPQVFLQKPYQKVELKNALAKAMKRD